MAGLLDGGRHITSLVLKIYCTVKCSLCVFIPLLLKQLAQTQAHVNKYILYTETQCIQVPADARFFHYAGCYERDLCGCRGVICFDSVSYDGKECRVEVITLACCQ